jgi:hypothetical protein
LRTYESGQTRTREIVLHITMLTIAYALAKTYQARERFVGLTDAATANAIEPTFWLRFQHSARSTRSRSPSSGRALASP